MNASAPVARGLSRWLPALLLLAAVAGSFAALLAMRNDEGARAWYGGRVGGSTLYELNLAFARLLPFAAVAGVALALLQRRRLHTPTAATAGAVQRHELTVVVTHWLNAVGLGLALVTAAWLLRWFGNPISLEATYALHFAGSLLTVGAVAHHLTFHLAGGGVGLVPRSWRDIRNAMAELVSYTGVYRGRRGILSVQLPLAARRPAQRALRRLHLAPDPAGKYLAVERVVSYPVWSLLIGVVVVTGAIKALYYLYPYPSGFRQFATFLHDGATIFIVIFLAAHVGSIVLVPRHWPLLRSMITTRIERRYVEQHLPRWVDALPAGGEEDGHRAHRPAAPREE
jgi:cytochrome b subunit of formate dehydrogenase